MNEHAGERIFDGSCRRYLAVHSSVREEHLTVSDSWISDSRNNKECDLSHLNHYALCTRRECTKLAAFIYRLLSDLT